MTTTTRENRKQKALIAILSGATKSGAARAAGIDRKTLYRWLDADLDFLMEFDAAWTRGEQKRTYCSWLNHPFRGLRPPTGKGSRSRPRFSR
jgi:transposase-like protein